MMWNAKDRSGVVPVLLVIAALGGCQSRLAPPVTSAVDPVAPAVSGKRILAVYEGVLPCADCQGIRTKLTLFEEDFTYRLVEIYLGTPDGDRFFESEGTWSKVHGVPKKPDAEVYQLNPGKSAEVRNFLVVDDRQIRQLDSAGGEIASQLDYTLTRKPPRTASR
jgi:copper homeostasis protein (lipoprotein)